MEPTGHYWFALGKFLQDNGMKPVHVNPHHVKKSKELDDNNPNKNDHKDPKTIAVLVNEGRFLIPTYQRVSMQKSRVCQTCTFRRRRNLKELRIESPEGLPSTLKIRKKQLNREAFHEKKSCRYSS